MAFRPVDFTVLIARAPARASRHLSLAFAAHHTTQAVADELGVGVNTVKRWIRLLTEAGHPIRDGVRAKRGWPLGRPRGPQIARNFRGRKKAIASR